MIGKSRDVRPQPAAPNEQTSAIANSGQCRNDSFTARANNRMEF